MPRNLVKAEKKFIKFDMENSDWLVRDDGSCQACDIPSDWEWSTKSYRLYRFLTDLEDILAQTQDEEQRLEAIRPLVRRLLTSSYWLQGEYSQPSAEKGWSVLMLYDEPHFPLTIQTVVWLPQRVSPIHNHGTWGIVALISGQEKNILWRRNPTEQWQDDIEQVGEKIIFPGDIISFTSDAIHSVEAMGDEPTISFNLYGKTNYEQRFEFDPLKHTAEKF